MRRTKPAQIYKKAGNLRAVQLLSWSARFAISGSRWMTPSAFRVGLAIVAVALTVRLYSQARRHLRDAVRTTLAPSESAAISG